jgi:hypothetical protein
MKFLLRTNTKDRLTVNLNLKIGACKYGSAESKALRTRSNEEIGIAYPVS